MDRCVRIITGRKVVSLGKTTEDKAKDAALIMFNCVHQSKGHFAL